MNCPIVRMGLLVLAALLALSGLGGTALAAGDLFDDDYADCPHKTRLRDGQIADLTVARDAEEEDHVNVAWAATDPATWGLGSNAYSTSLVVILDDGGDLETRTLALGSRTATFEGVATGTEVTVQMAIVVDTAEGDYLISDTLEQSIHQSLTEPSFSRAWRRVTALGDSDATAPGVQLHEGDVPFASKALKAGRMYYVGYNENFGNYKSHDDALVTAPATARLRIGLAHADQETDGARDDVDFQAYILRIVDADGDVVAEGDDVATVESRYGSSDFTYDHDGDTNTANKTGTVPFNLFLYGPGQLVNPSAAFDDEDKVGGHALSNVRIVDGGDITPAAHHNDALPAPSASLLAPSYLSRFAVNLFGVAITTLTGPDVLGNLPAVNEVYAKPPDEHRDFPLDTLASDETYTISAWAVNDDDEVISPVAKLKVRPKDTSRGAVAAFIDYKAPNTDGSPGRDPYALSNLTTTAFTVLK